MCLQAHEKTNQCSTEKTYQKCSDEATRRGSVVFGCSCGALFIAASVEQFMSAHHQFVAAMREARLSPAEPERIQQTGELIRYRVEGDKQGSLNGWCVFHSGSISAGAFGSWKTGESHTWHEKSERPFDAAQHAMIQAQITEARAQREREQIDRYHKAAMRAAAIWAEAKAKASPLAHPYLIRKGVGTVQGLRILDKPDPFGRRGSLVVPCYIRGQLSSLQFIDSLGDKRFLPGGKKRGGYFAIGSLNGSGYVAIVEGIATGLSVHEATGWPVVVAFDTSNLLAAGEAIQYRHPALTLVFCADNDTDTPGNPGLTKAKQAAERLGGILALAEALGRSTDWNDYCQIRGRDATRTALLKAIPNGGAHV
jgi:putative DNA primase/helicase